MARGNQAIDGMVCRPVISEPIAARSTAPPGHREARAPCRSRAASGEADDGPPHGGGHRPPRSCPLVERRRRSGAAPSTGRRAARSSGFQPLHTTSCQSGEADARRPPSFGQAARPQPRGPACGARRLGVSSASSPVERRTPGAGPRARRRACQRRPWRATSSRSRSVTSAASAATSGDSMRRGRGMSTSNSRHPARPAGEQHDAVGQAGRLAHVVGDEEHGHAGLRPRPARARRGGGRGSWRRARRRARPSAARRRPGRGPGPGRPAGACRPTARGAAGRPKSPRCTARAARLPGLPALRAGRRRAGAGPARRCRPPSATGTAPPPGTSAPARPSTSTVPGVGCSRPASRLSSVVLPQPDAPTRHTNSPAAMVRSTPSSATVPLRNTFPTPLSCARSPAEEATTGVVVSRIAVTGLPLRRIVCRPGGSGRPVSRQC